MLFMGNWPSYLPNTAWLEMPRSAAKSKNQSSTDSTERSRRHGAQVGLQGMSWKKISHVLRLGLARSEKGKFGSDVVEEPGVYDTHA